MIKSLVNSVAHKYAAATNPQAGNEDDAFASRLQSVVTAAKQKIEEERRLAVPAAGHSHDAPAAGHAESIAPTDTPPPRKENVTRLPHPTLPRENGNMEKGNANTSEIKCYLSLDELRTIIAEETARRLEPERLLGEYTKETTLFDDGRVEVTFSTSGSALGSTEG